MPVPYAQRKFCHWLIQRFICLGFVILIDTACRLLRKEQACFEAYYTSFVHLIGRKARTSIFWEEALPWPVRLARTACKAAAPVLLRPVAALSFTVTFICPFPGAGAGTRESAGLITGTIWKAAGEVAGAGAGGAADQQCHFRHSRLAKALAKSQSFSRCCRLPIIDLNPNL